MNAETQTPMLEDFTEDQLIAMLKKKQAAKDAEEQKERNKYEADKEAFLILTASKFKQLSADLKTLKDFTIIEANKLYNKMYELNDQIPKEQKSFSFKNKAGNAKVTVDRQERFEFNEEASVHINAIKDIFKDKFSDRNKGLYNILDGLLIKGTGGDYDPKLLAKARQQVKALGDEKLIEEFDKLADCQRVTGTSLYCRVHVLNELGKWQDVSLQFSNL